ncbi:hypothetical protein Mgra_00006288 [Meloidogyne graminicola]|uniref:Uncharacterized protein n=1 Tax=Meloidogyne graminicola TaxID=189291 RepID=A0A8S9ZM83_9BILA|nr:hypothetical protein Mgra_00006288 [Meloidogyne graminicola]
MKFEQKQHLNNSKIIQKKKQSKQIPIELLLDIIKVAAYPYNAKYLLPKEYREIFLNRAKYSKSSKIEEDNNKIQKFGKYWKKNIKMFLTTSTIFYYFTIKIYIEIEKQTSNIYTNFDLICFEFLDACWNKKLIKLLNKCVMEIKLSSNTFEMIQIPQGEYNDLVAERDLLRVKQNVLTRICISVNEEKDKLTGVVDKNLLNKFIIGRNHFVAWPKSRRCPLCDHTVNNASNWPQHLSRFHNTFYLNDTLVLADKDNVRNFIVNFLGNLGIKNNYALEIALIMLLSDEVGLTFETGITVDYGLRAWKSWRSKLLQMELMFLMGNY